MLLLYSVSFVNAAVDDAGGLEGVVTAVASDLSSQDVEFHLELPTTSLSTENLQQVDSPEVLADPCAECDWQVRVEVNKTTVIVVDEHTILIFSASAHQSTVIVPLSDCNVTSTTHEASQQSVVVLCDHSHSELPPKMFRYNYNSRKLTEIVLYSATNVMLRRGALFEFPSVDTAVVITHAIFPLAETPWLLRVYDMVTQFGNTVEVFPETCLAVQRATAVRYTSRDFILIHCSTADDSDEIGLLVLADLTENNFTVYFDLQSAGISYDPYTAVVHCAPSWNYCVIALHDSPNIVVLDLTSATFRTLSLAGVAKDAILVDNSCVMYSSASGLHWFSPVLLFSDDGTSHFPELVAGSTATCFPPACPRFQVINSSYVLTTQIHADRHSFIIHACGSEGVQFKGSVEIDISPSWYLPFVDQANIDPVSPSSFHSSHQSSVLPSESTVTPSSQPIGTAVGVSVVLIVLGAATFVMVAFIMWGATVRRKKRDTCLKNRIPMQVKEQQETSDVVVQPVSHGVCYLAQNHP